MVCIIVPIYNSERYLHRCIDSLLLQSFEDIEIILVDDGSRDNSGTICDDYALKDKRIKVIHQPNQGVSVARQTGLDNAKGKYVIHVDADDWIEPTAIELLYSKAKNDNADMVISDYWIESDNQEPFLVKQNFEETTSYQILLRLIKQELFGSCWNKLVKKEVIDHYHVKFHPTNITFCEDLLFNCKLLSHDIKVSHLNKAIYHYCTYNQNNLTNSLSVKRLESRIFVNSELEKMIDKDDVNVLFNQKYDVLKEAFLLRQFSVLKQQYHDVLPQIIKNRKATDYYLTKYLCMAFQGHPHIAYYLYKTRRLATIVWHCIMRT